MGSITGIRDAGVRAVHALIWVAAIAVVVQNFVLLKENRGLKALLSAPPAELASGRQLLNLAGTALDGHFESVALPSVGRDRVLIITFSPGVRPVARVKKGGQPLPEN